MSNVSDWDRQTILRKPKPTAKDARSTATVNRALATGTPVEVLRKMNAGTNKNLDTSVNTTKIAEDPDIVKVESVPLDVAKAIQRARAELGLSQKDLATKINEKPAVVNDYEAGRGHPNQLVLSKLERALGVKLRGAQIGSKFETKPAKN